jgi:catechol 2,3-dioxygenase-like lactoylglutathione lyase family enzyme
MIGYVTLGTNDLPRAARFYDQLLGLIGAKRMMEQDTFIAWSAGADQPGIGITKPFNGKAATVGNGTMVAFHVDSKEMVKAVYAKALALGGTDEGPPGLRFEGYYGAYFRDLDGNKLNAHCVGPAATAD